LIRRICCRWVASTSKFITSQKAALVEETNSAASALRAQAEVLQSEIANFRVA
jgi:methyl-accepting chemotaxis protein